MKIGGNFIYKMNITSLIPSLSGIRDSNMATILVFWTNLEPRTLAYFHWILYVNIMLSIGFFMCSIIIIRSQLYKYILQLMLQVTYKSWLKVYTQSNLQRSPKSELGHKMMSHTIRYLELGWTIFDTMNSQSVNPRLSDIMVSNMVTILVFRTNFELIALSYSN